MMSHLNLPQWPRIVRWISMTICFLLAACDSSSPLSPTVTPTITTTPTITPVAFSLPGSTIPEGLGAVYFNIVDPTELDILTDSGLRFVRRDLAWAEVETVKGQRLFSWYDEFVERVSRQGIRIIFILDYSNPLYDSGLSPHTDEGRAAFAQFAADAAERYAGKGIIWEIWNEPNLSEYWQPRPNAHDYALLALATIDAIRQVDSDALIVGPAVSNLQDRTSWEFLTTLGELGVFKKLDAVSVHPYRGQIPETAEEDYLQLRRLLDVACPNCNLPIISGEWGYSTVGSGLDENQQAEYLVRTWLVNLSNGINLNIWFSWKDEGLDPGNWALHMGILNNDLSPKPAYWAVQTLTHTLEGYQFIRRITTDNQDDYLLLFRNTDGEVILTTWTIGDPHTIAIPPFDNRVTVVSMAGDQRVLERTGDSFEIEVTGAPEYLLLGNTSLAQELASWHPVEAMYPIGKGEASSIEVQVVNPMDSPRSSTFAIRVGDNVIGQANVVLEPSEERTVSIPVLYRGDENQEFIPAEILSMTEGLPEFQASPVWLAITNALKVEILPTIDQVVPIIISNPWRRALSAQMSIGAEDIDEIVPVTFEEGQNETTVTYQLPSKPPAGAPITVSIFDQQGLLLQTASAIWKPVGTQAPQHDWWSGYFFGEGGEPWYLDLSVVDTLSPPQTGLDTSLKVDYRVGSCSRYISVAPTSNAEPLFHEADFIGMWVYGNNSWDSLMVDFLDSANQGFSMSFDNINWEGWRFVIMEPKRGIRSGAPEYHDFMQYPVLWYWPWQGDETDLRFPTRMGLSISIGCGQGTKWLRTPLYLTGIATGSR